MAGAGIGQILSWLSWLTCVVLGVIVGVKILKKQGTGLGVLAIVLGVFCILPTLIWGWVKFKELGIKNLMIGYTIAFVLMFVGSFIAGASVFGGLMSSPEFQEAMQEAQRGGAP